MSDIVYQSKIFWKHPQEVELLHLLALLAYETIRRVILVFQFPSHVKKPRKLHLARVIYLTTTYLSLTRAVWNNEYLLTSVYFTMLSTAETTRRRMLQWLETGRLELIWKQTIVTVFDLRSRHLPGGHKETSKSFDWNDQMGFDSTNNIFHFKLKNETGFN